MTTTHPESRASVVYLPHGDIAPSPSNPRKHFDALSLEELKKSLLAHSFTAALSHLLVRPLPDGTGYELICGERRWRAAGELIAEGKLSADVPAVVLPLSDLEALELQMVENMQRSDLTPLEEAEGLHRLLELRDEADQPLHSVETLAAKLGRTKQHVLDRLSLLGLRGSAAGDALESGEIGIAHARLLARVPSGATRDELTRRVLKPLDGNGPLPSRMLEKIIRHEYVVELRGAGFDPKDEALLPIVTDAGTGERVRGGSCTECPFNSKNDPENAGGKFPMCRNPECYRAKEEAHHLAWMLKESNEEKNRTALSLEEGRGLLDYSGVKLSYSSRHVDLSDRPDEDLLKRGAANPPTWKRLLSGSGIPIKVLRDTNGKVHEVVEAKLALDAAREAEKASPAADRIFRSPERESKKETPSEREARIRSEVEAGELRRRVKEAQEKAILHAAVSKGELPADLWKVALPLLYSNAIDFTDDEDFPEELPKKLSKEELAGMVVRCLLIFAEVDGYPAPPYEEAVTPFAKLYDVDLAAIRKGVDKEFTAEAAAAKEKAALADLINWGSERMEADEFEWNESGVCEEPNRGELVLPKGSDLKLAVITIARHEKGWVYGFSVTTKAGGSSHPVKSVGPFYDRPAAVRRALLSVKANCPCALMEKKIGDFLLDLNERANAKKSTKGGKSK